MKTTKTDSEKIAEWNRETSLRDTSLFTSALIEGGLDLSQVVTVVEALDRVCTSCFDDTKGCQCWNDL